MSEERDEVEAADDCSREGENEGVFFSCSFKKHQPGISSSHQPLLEPVEQSQAQACDRGGLERICEAEREGEREGR